MSNKIVPIHANPALKDRCHVRVLDLYYAKLPKDAMEKDVFHHLNTKLDESCEY